MAGPPACTRAHRIGRSRTASGGCSRNTTSRACTRPRPRSGRSCGGATNSRSGTHWRPCPAMLQTLYHDPEGYEQVYWSQVPGEYFTGDGARMDEDGFFWLMGRIDDVINVAGHRIGTMEVESALVSHEKVAEAAVVGKPHLVKGQSLVAYVVLKRGQPRADGLKKELQKEGGEGGRREAVADEEARSEAAEDGT